MTPPLPEDETASETAARELSGHIFSVSAGLVGVCLTVIGLFRLFAATRARSWADNLLAMDALAFLFSCLLAYLALRARAAARRRRLERLADSVFLLGLAVMVLIGGLVAYELI